VDWDDVRNRLRGPGALISTIFDKDFSLDAASIGSNVEYIVERGMGREAGYLISPCGDGEYVTLSPEEHRLVVETVVQAAGGDVAVVAGAYANDYRLIASLAQGARDAGAIGVMVAPPVYYPLNEDALVDWYRRLADAVDIGIMVYEQAWRGPGVNAGVTPDLVGRLLEIPNVVALKHSGWDELVDQFTIIDRYHDRLNYMDTTACYAMTAAHMHGAAGYVSEVGAWWPELELEYWRLLEKGDYKQAELHHARVNPVIEFVRAHPAQSGAISSISVLKASLEYVGLKGGVMRPPFRALDDAEKARLHAVLDALDVPTAVSGSGV
jgi:dihydrodipicolinate synthase/N-acetylneuraminate lyase